MSSKIPRKGVRAIFISDVVQCDRLAGSGRNRLWRDKEELTIRPKFLFVMRR